MAFNTLISLLVLLTPLSLLPSSTNALSPIEQVCPKTTNPQLCFQALNADPNAPHATEIIEIAIPAINSAQSTIGPTRQILNDLISTTDDPLDIEYYYKCLDQLVLAEYALAEAKDSLDLRRFDVLSDWGRTAANDMKDCDTMFGREHVEPAQLKQHSKDEQDLSDVVRVIGDMLDQAS